MAGGGHAEVRDEILAVVDQERAAVEKGNISQYLAVLADGAVFMPPNAAPKEGAELRSWLSNFIEHFAVEWLAFRSTEVIVVSDLAYHAYTYSWRVTPRAGGEPTTASGKGLHILRQQTDGSWGIAREIWNGSPTEDPA